MLPGVLVKREIGRPEPFRRACLRAAGDGLTPFGMRSSIFPDVRSQRRRQVVSPEMLALASEETSLRKRNAALRGHDHVV